MSHRELQMVWPGPGTRCESNKRKENNCPFNGNVRVITVTPAHAGSPLLHLTNNLKFYCNISVITKCCCAVW